jgi:N-acetylmuramoyl-L-alanine amidase
MKFTSTPSPNFNERPSAIDAIIIHYTDMASAEAALAWLVNPASQVSAHYLIDEEGHVYGLVDEKHRAWHAGESYWQGCTNLNDCSIGIELANPGHTNGYQPFPETQIISLIKLCLDIQKRWNIPNARILGHSDISPQRKQDPGHLFPWKRLADEGLGLWPDVVKLSTVCPERRPAVPKSKGEVSDYPSFDFGPKGPTLRTNGERNEDLIQTLSRLGYDISSPLHAVSAFQRRFQPHKTDGIADQETRALAQGLLA